MQRSSQLLLWLSLVYNCYIKVSCKAFIGAPLSESEFLKIEQTHLADVIAAEVGNEHYRTQDVAPKQSSAAEVI